MAANDFQQPGPRYARTAVGLLVAELDLGNTVWRDFDTAFKGKVGYTVNARIPAKLTAREYTATPFAEHTGSITLDNIDEGIKAITLDKLPYSGVAITDEELTLVIEDFEDQVLMPQVQAVAEKVESYVVAEMQGATYATTVAMDPDVPWAAIVAARAALNASNVPRADRFLAVGPGLESAILSDPDLLRNVSASGSSATLRRAEIGQLAGFTVIGSGLLDDDEGYAYHRTAYVLATRSPVVPQGAVAGGQAAYQGYAVRWIRDYDPMKLQDRSVVSTFAGTDHITDGGTFQRAVKLALSGS